MDHFNGGFNVDVENTGLPNQRGVFMPPTTNYDQEVKQKSPQIFKLGPFKIDISYPKTLPGFVRTAQVILLVVAFISSLADTSAEIWTEQQGTFAFFCSVLAIASAISSYFLFTILTNSREAEFCGVSWRFVELLYFGVFGGFVFLGSCLAANKAAGNTSIIFSAIFGFISCITFVHCFITTWKSNQNEELDKNEEDREKGAPSIVNESLAITRPHSYHGYGTEDNFMINQNVPMHRRMSASDKDSAYSESIFGLHENGIIPQRMKRTTSAHSMGFNHPQTYPSMMQSNFEDDQISQINRRNSKRRKNSVSFPQRLATSSFSNAGYDHSGMNNDFEAESTVSEIPGWLRAALDDDDIVGAERNTPAIRQKQRPSFDDFAYASDGESTIVPMSYDRKQNHFQTLPTNNYTNNINSPNPMQSYRQQANRRRNQHHQNRHFSFASEY